MKRIYGTIKILYIVVAGNLSAMAQDVFPAGLFPSSPPDQALFTPDVAKDLVGQARIRVDLSFKGDSWALIRGSMEPGILSTYPDGDGFVRAELLNSSNERLVSVGVPDPRIVRIYELSELAGVERVEPPHLTPRPSRNPVEERIRLLEPQQPETSKRQIRPQPPTKRMRRDFRTDQFQGTELVTQEDARLRPLRTKETMLLQPPQRPPHQDVSMSEGTVILYLPYRTDACSVRVTIVGVGGQIIQLDPPPWT